MKVKIEIKQNYSNNELKTVLENIKETEKNLKLAEEIEVKIIME